MGKKIIEYQEIFSAYIFRNSGYHLNSKIRFEIKTWYRPKIKEDLIRKGLLLNNKPF